MKKIALIHDHLTGVGGSERVFQYLCEEFAEADIYTLCCNFDKTYPFFKTRRIQTTWLNSFIQTPDAFRWSFPIARYAMQNLNLSKYDLVISSSATVAKYVQVPHGLHICYCYMPTRALWHFDRYFQSSTKKKLLKPLLHLLKNKDFKVAQEIDHFIAISEASKNYIKQFYHREAAVIPCPIETEKFSICMEKKEHFLLVSRLEHWKKVDYAIEAFNQLKLPLKIIGGGAEKERLQNLAKNNIEFLGEVDDARLAREYQQAKAVIFTPFLEYGLIPLEANSTGTPVIAYGKGGISETMIPHDNKEEICPTAVFFYEQTAKALIEAVKIFEGLSFNPSYVSEHAKKWSIPSFKRKFRQHVENLSSSQINEKR